METPEVNEADHRDAAPTMPFRQETRSIPTRTNLAYEDFVAEFLNPNKPVIIADGVKDWKAIGKWTPEFFASRYPRMEVEIDGTTYSMPGFIERVRTSRPEAPAPYLRNRFTADLFPDLLGDLAPKPCYILPNWHRGPFYPSKGYRETEVFIGGCGAGFPTLHYDGNATHAFLAQVYGEKEVVLYSPDDTELIYPKKNTLQRHHSLIDSIESPDLERFPLFERAVAYRGTMSAGALVFLPSRWWHTARMHSPSITISHNVANASNWPLISDEVCHKARFKLPAPMVPAVAAYMKLVGWGHALYDAVTRRRG